MFPSRRLLFYLFAILGLQVTFTSQPLRNDDGIIKGCLYKSRQDMADFSYLLLNDTIRINYTTKSEAGSTPDFTLSSYRFKGRFQCVIFDETRMKKPAFSNYSDFISLSGRFFMTLLSQKSQCNLPEILDNETMMTKSYF